MKKNLLAAAIAIAMAAPVYAAQTNTGCQGNCTGDTTNNTTNAGGAGGIGIGGSGIAVATGGNSSATGGNSSSNSGVVGSGNSSSHVNSSIRNEVDNANSQSQNQSSRNANRNNNSNRNQNNSNAANSNTNANAGNNAAQSTSTMNSVQVTGDTYVAPRIPVATAYAPNNVPTATCMGSSSVGFSAVGFSMSGGSSWVDTNCQLLEQVRTVAQVLGQPQVAAAMMMEVPAYRAAVEKVTGRAAPASKAADVGVDKPQQISYNLLNGN